MSFEIISVIGFGYIGLPIAAVFASYKKQVVGIDVNQYIVDVINQGRIHIVEPELDIIVKKAVEEGYLKVFTKPQNADAYIIAVPTPLKDNKKPDLTYVRAAAESIALVLKKGDLVVLESTSPIGTTEQLTRWMANIRVDLTFPNQMSSDSDIDVAYCPERVMPGQIMSELIKNDRVIGGITRKSSLRAKELYSIFLEGKCFITNARTAEMCKLTENSFRDVNIAFANELSLLCDKQKINVWELIKIANCHPRVNILQPGPGVGGHCIAVDPWFIVAQNSQHSRLIRTARLVNDYKPIWVFNQVKSIVKNFLNEKEKKINEIKISCFGLSFKANIDDLRESPAIHIVKKIANWNQGKTYVVEPHIRKLPSSLLDISELISIEKAIDISDIILMLVDHDIFKNINNLVVSKKIVIDTRGVWC
ncbi:UDP-N-acetyl-D-mannosamine dehydrogenase [Candidatus Providencia siddallii]|uniref:UDP-N-acetyl-D-mannosamine dehydrogenase n=1 Tax=Candidatus Providencia siddallii TaxID=1715285 RepID=A0A0M6W7C0_9GAMM|nr:UDP-N-acetyl-D-mannosamine dehydrogenase [Candidatus Providencia siddallii]